MGGSLDFIRERLHLPHGRGGRPPRRTPGAGAFLLRSSMDPPWSLRIEDEAPLTLVAMVRGEAWLVPDDDGPSGGSRRGDVAILRGPDPYTVADDPGTPPQVLILPGQVR